MSTLRKRVAALEKKHHLSALGLAMYIGAKDCECAINARLFGSGVRAPCVPCRCRAYHAEVSALLGVKPTQPEKTR